MEKKKIITKSGIEVTINPELDKYDNVVLFPKKLEKANRILREVGLPKQLFKDIYVSQD
jgi:hypothetical protein